MHEVVAVHETVKNPFLGTWRILEMEQWDRDYIDLVVPGYIEFEKGNLGSFQFGPVQGGIDYRPEITETLARLTFSWEGMNDNDPGSGWGRAEIRGGQLFGHLCFHQGEDSWSKAKRR